MTAGSAHEPSPDPASADAQMRDATERLRDKAWMVAPMTAAVTALPVDESAQDGAA